MKKIEDIIESRDYEPFDDGGVSLRCATASANEHARNALDELSKMLASDHLITSNIKAIIDHNIEQLKSELKP